MYDWKRRHCRLTRPFTCQCKGGLHSIFQPDFQCLICWAFPGSLERCFHIPVPVRILFGGDAYPFIWQKSRFLHSQCSNLDYRLSWFIGDFCSPVFPLPPSWLVNTCDTTRKGWGAGLKKKQKSQSSAVQYSLPLILELASIALQGLLAN